MNEPSVQLWLVKTGDFDPLLLSDALDQTEKARALRYRFEADHNAYVVAHALRRLAVAAELKMRPGDIKFGRSAQGRPTLEYPSASYLGFSVSRRRAMVALATARRLRLGVDVENVGGIPDPLPLLGKFLDSVSLAGLEGLEGRALQIRFAQLWTITEACSKARGTGLETFLPRMSVNFEASDLAIVIDGANQWHCQLFSPDPGHCAAIAYENAGFLPVSLRDWPGT